MILIIIGCVAIVAGIALSVHAQRKMAEISALKSKLIEKRKHVERKLEDEKRSFYSKMKYEMHQKRKEFDFEIKKEKLDIERVREQIVQRQNGILDKEQSLEDIKYNLQDKERDLSRQKDSLRISENKIKNLYNDLIVKLEQISNMSKDEAARQLKNTLESEVKHTSEKWIQKVENEARETAKQKSIDIVSTAMQRYTADEVNSATSGTVRLPHEDMKGRIIGKEGRNIKALEMATGMEFIIGDTPEVITVSGFNPIRREIAKRSLERLISDGRINPTRIEETVAKCESEVDDLIEEYGRNTVLEFNLQGIHPEMVKLLGRLHFRTSFSQNVLQHSKEVGIFARMIAEELGLDGSKALRAALLHDIGKAVSAEIEGPHALVGADLAKKYGESDDIVNAIAAHHGDVPYESVYAVLVVIADTISAARPGARRETLATYIKKLKKLEEIAHSFDGVKKAYALQAGREVRIIIQEDVVAEEDMQALGREVAKKIEAEMNYPGEIKVNIIREKRSVEYAR